MANFAERWIDGKTTRADAVADFLSDTIQDHFEVEVTASVAFPVARLLSILYEESRNGITTGLVHILGEDRFNETIKDTETIHKTESPKLVRDSDPKKDSDKISIRNKVIENSTNVVEKIATNLSELDLSDSKIDETQELRNMKEEQKDSVPRQEEEDGWTLVKSKKNKKKGKRFD